MMPGAAAMAGAAISAAAAPAKPGAAAFAKDDFSVTHHQPTTTSPPTSPRQASFCHSTDHMQLSAQEATAKKLTRTKSDISIGKNAQICKAEQQELTQYTHKLLFLLFYFF